MKQIKITIEINAPVEKVWDTMLEDSTYRVWTAPFSKGSHFVGDWNEGSKILFLGPDEDGNLGGMVSRIKSNIPHKYISIEHLGIVENGVEDTTSPEAKKWAPAYENYSFEDVGGKTKLTVESDMEDEEIESFENMWHESLQVLKELAEEEN